MKSTKTEGEIVMASKIEDTIDEIANYIDGCKSVPLSSDKIMVNKDEFLDMLDDLRASAPDEIARYQKIISNREAILADAKKQADQMVSDARQFADSSVNEHIIMQQAYDQANQVVQQATEQAQMILDQASMDANSVRMSAIQYMDDTLANIQGLLQSAIQTTQSRNESLVLNMQQYLQTIIANRAELQPGQEDVAAAERAEAEKLAQAASEKDSANLDMFSNGNE